jgi:hypothetical protein
MAIGPYLEYTTGGIYPAPAMLSSRRAIHW